MRRSSDLASNPVQTVSPSYPEDWAFTAALSAPLLLSPWAVPTARLPTLRSNQGPYRASRFSKYMHARSSWLPSIWWGSALHILQTVEETLGEPRPSRTSATKRREGPSLVQGTTYLPTEIPGLCAQRKVNYRCFAEGKRPHLITTDYRYVLTLWDRLHRHSPSSHVGKLPLREEMIQKNPFSL